jgi:hypothetical protein
MLLPARFVYHTGRPRVSAISRRSPRTVDRNLKNSPVQRRSPDFLSHLDRFVGRLRECRSFCVSLNDGPDSLNDESKVTPGALRKNWRQQRPRARNGQPRLLVGMGRAPSTERFCHLPNSDDERRARAVLAKELS